jgi:hypothetical protein
MLVRAHLTRLWKYDEKCKFIVEKPRNIDDYNGKAKIRKAEKWTQKNYSTQIDDMLELLTGRCTLIQQLE